MLFIIKRLDNRRFVSVREYHYCTRKAASHTTCCVNFNITYILASKQVNEEVSGDNVLDRIPDLHGSHRYSIMEYCCQNHLNIFDPLVPYLLIKPVRFLVFCVIAFSPSPLEL